ncbi:hypothetical protein [Rhodococcus ruber]|uniref:Uncharacterized protein n=1 Tax=Rhodococcus ruber TaxID=1830 RepID=A0A098BPH2_9NOCA|nr:hypothetical protein [Rhodococcus ruber]MBP2211849.1 hypothetical protein [Rhodococcus ruber]MCZ1074553.1 hypothetical protein [Rhodococcus sp. A5(2022)]CDZ89631.1 hypothetical protein RHRU231_520010 [Rhodococcus ruber]
MTASREPESDAWAAVHAGRSGLVWSQQTVASVGESITSLAKDTLPGSVGAGITLLAADGAEALRVGQDRGRDPREPRPLLHPNQ